MQTSKTSDSLRPTLVRVGRLLFASLALGVGVALPAAAAPGERPNIVLILADDLGYSDFGAYGSEVSTPNVDALAARGVVFSNHHTSPMCAPSRAMLMTGVSSHRAGVGNLPEFIPPSWTDKPGYLGHLAPDVVTIAQRLKPLGYDTYMTGKWHLGHEDRTLPSERGFDRSFALDATGADNWQDRSYLPLTEALWYEDGKRVHLPDDWYSSRNLVDKMIEYVGERSESAPPFFAYLAFQAVHIPVQAPAEFRDKYLGTYAGGWEALREARRAGAVAKGLVPADSAMRPIPPELRHWDALDAADREMATRSMAVYAGMLEAMDFHLGRFIEHLKATGQYDNTLFIVTSDNGAEGSDPLAVALMRAWFPFSGYHRDLDTLGELGSYVFIGPEFANAASSPGPWFKFTSAEGGLRVPLIIAAPGMEASRVNRGLSYVTDVPATIFDYASPAPAAAGEMSGRSLRPVVEGAAAAVRSPEDVIGLEAAGHSALFQGDYKLTRIYPPHGDKQWRLYDIARDPGETANLADEQPERFRAMLAEYQTWADANQVIPIPEDYDAFKQIQLNFVHFLWKTKPWLFAIPVALLVVLAVGLRGAFRWLRRAVA